LRDQYAGDVSDFLKFALLRALADTDRRLGVAWYYVPGDDGRPDGRHLEWRRDDAWKALDPVVHAALSTLSDRSVAALERASLWPGGTLFHRKPVPRDASRHEWAVKIGVSLAQADLVFLDPDNGIGDRKEKHAKFSEIAALRDSNRSLIAILFPGRSKPHHELIKHLHERIRERCGSERVLTVRTNVSVPRTPSSPYLVQRPRWFTVIDPDDTIVARARSFADALHAIIPAAAARVDEAIFA
jgi:hypothetical protein